MQAACCEMGSEGVNHPAMKDLTYENNRRRTQAGARFHIGYVNPWEAKELASALQHLNVKEGDHCHLDDEEYKREITIAVYTNENLHYYAEEIRKIINS